MTTWKQHKLELMRKPGFKTAYDALEPEYRLADEMIAARLSQKLTQEQVAHIAGVNRTVIARLEGGAGNPTLETISRVARALGMEVTLAKPKSTR